MRTLILAALLLPFAAEAAGEFAARYPAGSIQDEIAAKTAQKDADAELARIAKDAKARDAECYRRILVNSCRDDVRRSKELAEREVKRVRVEARDVQRKIEADRVATRRSEEDAARAAESAQRAQKEEKARAEAAGRETAAKQRADAQAARTSSSASPTTESQRTSSAKDRLTAAERAENVRKYEEKQALAQKHAQQQEVERKENEKKREERRKQIEQREAEREAIRKKAAELVNQ